MAFWTKKKPEERAIPVATANLTSFTELISLVGDNVMNIPTVYACVNAISSGIASVPIKVQRNIDNEWIDDSNHYLNKVLANPSKLYNKNVFIETLVKDALINKGGYAIIERNAKRKTKALYRISPNKVQIVPDNYTMPTEVFYKVDSMKSIGKNADYDSDDVLTLVNKLSDDNYNTQGITSFSTDTTNLSNLLTNNAITSFKEGSDRYIIGLKGRANAAKMQDTVNAFKGMLNGGVIGVESDGVEVKDLTKSAKESMLVEARKFSAVEICTYFNIQPAFIGLDAQASMTAESLEAMHRQFITVCLEPWYDKLELEFKKVLTTAESEKYRIVFDRTANLKTSPKNQAEVYSKLVLNGICTPNEAARRMGLPVIDGGDKLVIVGGVAPLELLNEIAYKTIDKKLKQLNDDGINDTKED